jgi:CubicO group peptidase (beta-lactamase class C family)
MTAKATSACAVLALLLLCSTPAASAPLDVTQPENVGMSSARLAHLKDYFQDLLDDEKTGGYQILISRRGKIVMYENLGWANVEKRIPYSDETLFRIFSMTKPVIGVAMMMLYEEGAYSLNDPLFKHIPEFSNLKVFAGTKENGALILEEPKRPPTIHDLLQHTAGFTYGSFSDTPIDALYRDTEIPNYDDTLQVLIDKLAKTPLLYHPGEKWHYSVAVDVQGYLIEKWTGMTVEDFLKERIIEPLDMDQTMAWVPEEKSALLANVYTHDEDGKQVKFDGALATNHFRAPGGFAGGAQLISTSEDYWRFCQMLLNGGEFEGKRYLSPRTVELMTTDRLRAPAKFGTGGRGFGLDFGVIVDRSKEPFPVSDGEYWWGGLANTVFWIDPKEDMVAIMFTQYLPWAGAEYEDLFHRLVRAAIID